MVVLGTPFFMAGACSPQPTGLTQTREAAVLVNDLNDSAWPRDLITLDSAVVTAEGRLRLFTKYGGGCTDHAAALLVNRAFMESSPPQLAARIAHDGHDDPCDALVAWTLEFDLRPVRDHYRANYGSDTGTVVLNLGGRQITYDFR